MTDKQPEALRLAKILDSYPVGSPAGTKRLAAAELRRLHQVNVELVEFNDQLCAENDRLLEQRTELVEALEKISMGGDPRWANDALQRLNKAAEDNGEEL